MEEKSNEKYSYKSMHNKASLINDIDRNILKFNVIFI